jgi:hypothetical protein
MSILKVSCSVFLNWVCWTRGNLLASRVTYAFMCASPLCGVPGRYEHIWSLCWSGCRAGTRILGNPLIRLAGLYGLFRLLGIVLAWMCVIKQVEGGGGGRDSTIFFFLVSLAFLVGPVRLKWWGVLYLNFHFLQFAVNSLGGWMCAVGILSFTFYCVL